MIFRKCKFMNTISLPLSYKYEGKHHGYLMLTQFNLIGDIKVKTDNGLLISTIHSGDELVDLVKRLISK